jgi:hypothetical protein
VTERPDGIPLNDVVIDETARVEHCRSCGALIWWGKTRAGRSNPFDVVDGARTNITHFSTCPDANKWGKSR